MTGATGTWAPQLRWGVVEGGLYVEAVHPEHEHPRRWQNDNAVKVRAMRAILRGGGIPADIASF